MENSKTQTDKSEDNVFRVFVPEKKTAILLDQEVDVTIIPARAAFKFIQFSKKHKGVDIKSSGSGLDEGTLYEILDIVEEITTRSNPTVTKEWLLNNLEMPDLARFITFIFKNLTPGSTGGTQGKTGGAKGKNQT